MTATVPTLDITGADAAEQRLRLQKHFGRADIFFFLVCTLVGIDGLGTLASSGGAGFTWLMFCVVAFAVPSSMVLAELGAAYSDEGGAYVWVRMAFGRLAGAVNNFFYWVTNPVWMGGTLVATAAAGITTFFTGSAPSRTAMYAFGLLFIWAGVLFAVLSFRIGKWVATVGAFARFILLGGFVVLIATYGAKHGIHGIGPKDFKPTYSSFVALVPVILFSLVGFELPSAAGEEMTDAARDVPAGIAKSVVTTAALYGLPVLGILFVLPADQIQGLSGFPDAVRQALSVFGGSIHTAADGDVSTSLTGLGQAAGWLMGLLVVIVAFTSGLTWIMGSDRALAVSCYDGAGPRSLGIFSQRFGTPLRVNLASGFVSTAVFIATMQISDGDALKFFRVGLALAISTTLISYLAVFPAALVLRRRSPGRELPYRCRLLPLMTLLSVAAIVFCTIETLLPGFGDGWFTGDYLPADWDPSERWTYLATEGVPLLAFAAIAVGFWALGRRHLHGRSSTAAKDNDSTLTTAGSG